MKRKFPCMVKQSPDAGWRSACLLLFGALAFAGCIQTEEVSPAQQATQKSVATPAPTVTQAMGTFAHKGAVTITGSGFGTKPQAAPLVWDDASGTNVLDKWSGYWPTTAPTSSSNMQYMTPIRGVNPPHNRVGKYLTGAHEG